MSILSSLKSLLAGTRKQPARAEKTFDAEQFIYVKLPGAIGPIDRGEMFEDRIDPVLAQADLGAVSGGGSSLSDPQPDGSRHIEFCGIDIDAKDRDMALVALRELLPKLNVPLGTELHYTRGGRKLQDEFGHEGWRLEQPRALLHPGFSV